jgi:signal transduction histidine kinase
MGLGVVTMHYTGMAAVRMDAQMLYRPGLFALSVANAIVCSTVALWLVFRLGTQSRHGGAARYRLASAFFMGIAICGMHYTAIHAGVCVSPRAVADAIVPLDPDLQTMVIGGVALLFTSVVLGVSMQNQIVSAKLRAQNEQLRDQIEERRRVEAALLEAKQLAEAANQAKSEFLSNMSHELRTPMHAILSFSKIGMERAGEAQREKLLRYFTNIDRSATRLMVLLNDVLDLSKIEAGKMKFEFCRADMGAAIRAVVEEFEETARARGVGIDTRIEASQPHAEIDSTRMQQVVRNLVSNAVKFSPDGGHVQVRLADCASPDGDSAPWLLLTVTDQGPGIPADELQLVFEKFVQSSKTKTGAGGTGLGLAIVREIMQAHGGGVHARNRPGGGAEFLAAFPARGACDGRPNAMVAADCARPAARPAVAAPDSAGQNEAGADLRISPAAPSR